MVVTTIHHLAAVVAGPVGRMTSHAASNLPGNFCFAGVLDHRFETLQRVSAACLFAKLPQLDQATKLISEVPEQAAHLPDWVEQHT